jgi:putative membrane protein
MTPSEGQWSRLHPTSLVVRAAAYAKKLVLPAVFVLVLARNSSWEVWLLIAFVPALAFEFFRYFTLRYRLGPEELVVRKGLIFRSERHIPFSRIQNINLVQGPLHRWFGVADVSIETAGGKEPEAILKVLSVDAVGRMRRQVFTGQDNITAADFSIDSADSTVPGAATPSPAGRAEAPRKLILQLDPRELAVLGLITVRGLALVAVLFGLGWELDLWDNIDIRGWISQQMEQGISTLERILAVAGLLVAVPTLAALSIAWSFLRFYDYRLEASGEDLHVSCGLLTRRTATIPRHRIQLISIRETILHRAFARVSVRVETAAGLSEQDEEAKDRMMAQRWFIPIVRREELGPVLRQVLPRLELEGVRWHALPPTARARMMKRNSVIAMLASVPVAWFTWPWGLAAPLVLVPLGLWHAHRAARFIGWDHAPFGMAFRSGVLTRCLSATFPDKMQVISLRQSPFDRRHRMATLRIDTAGAGPADHALRIPFLMRETAEGLAAALLREVDRRPLHVPVRRARRPRPAEAPSGEPVELS